MQKTQKTKKKFKTFPEEHQDPEDIGSFLRSLKTKPKKQWPFQCYWSKHITNAKCVTGAKEMGQERYCL